MKKRTLSILLTLCLLLGIAAGCGQAPAASASAPEPTEAPSAAAPAGEASAETPAPLAPEEPSVQEVSVQEEPVRPQVTYPLTDDPVTLTMWAEQPSLGPLRMWGDYGIDIFEDYGSIQQAAEITGVQVSFENASSENASTLFNLHIAAGDWADMIAGAGMYYMGGVNQAYNDGVLIDLSPYLAEYCPDYAARLFENDELSRAATNEEGSVLQICSLMDSFMQSEGTVIRKDWLDAVGMEVPTDIESLYQVLLAFQSEIGCANPFYVNSACNQLMTSYNLPYIQNLASNDLAILQTDGVVYSAFTCDRYQLWLENMSKWYSQGLIDSDFISVSSNNMGGHDEELLAADNIGVWWGNVNSLTNYFSICPAEAFDVVPTFITATEDPANHVTSTSLLFGGSSGGNGTGISAACRQPELALGWLNYWYTDEGIMLMNYGVEGVSYELVDGQVQYTETITNNEQGLDPALALKLHSIAGTSFGVQCDEHTFPFYIQQQLDAVEVWTAPCDGAWAYPSVSMATGESDTIAALSADICTYIAESVPRFIMGELNLTSDWDAFVETVNTMGMTECVSAYQAALDRYNQN